MNEELKKALDVVKCGGVGYNEKQYTEALCKIENTLNNYEEENCILNLCNNKKVNINLMFKVGNSKAYNYGLEDKLAYQLTEEEFNKIKLYFVGVKSTSIKNSFAKATKLCDLQHELIMIKSSIENINGYTLKQITGSMKEDVIKGCEKIEKLAKEITFDKEM